MSISGSNAMDGWCQFLFRLSNKKVYVIRHQAISVEMAALWKCLPHIINRINHIPQDGQKAEIVLTVFKDVLFVSTTHHHMIDAGPTDFSGPSSHIFFNNPNLTWGQARCEVYNLITPPSRCRAGTQGRGRHHWPTQWCSPSVRTA